MNDWRTCAIPQGQLLIPISSVLPSGLYHEDKFCVQYCHKNELQ